MKSKILFTILLVTIFVLFGCTQTQDLNLSVKEVYEITQTHKDFQEFNQIYPNFNPINYDYNYIGNKTIEQLSVEWSEHKIYKNIPKFFTEKIEQGDYLVTINGEGKEKIVAIININSKKAKFFMLATSINVGGPL